MQLCEWHGIEAIKRHLVAAGMYPKEQRNKVIDLIWKWVKSQGLNKLETNRIKLLNALLPAEREYLLTNYKRKEHQFVCAYIKMYPNLGVNSTQPNKSYHAVLKSFVNRHISLADSIHCLKDHIEEIKRNDDVNINRLRKKAPVCLDPVAFSRIKRLLTWYSLGGF